MTVDTSFSPTVGQNKVRKGLKLSRMDKTEVLCHYFNITIKLQGKL